MTLNAAADFAEALAHDDAARRFFDGLAFTHRKEWVRWIEDTTRPQTRGRRIAQAIELLRAGERTR
jgi:uncharacterized protein YdeI (YjbR/CyaY-like superfamily)